MTKLAAGSAPDRDDGRFPVRIDWRYPLLVAAIGAALYVNALPNGFTLDDVPIVRDNPDVQSPAGIVHLFSRPYWPEGGRASGLYRPATVASYVWNRAWTGPGPAGFHAVNALLHAAVCVLVWFVARRSSRYYGTALATAVLFAVHPVHTEAVANIVGRAELLAALGVLAGWIAHRRSAEAATPEAALGWAATAGAALFLAAVSKEHAVVAPAVYALHDVLRGRETGTSALASLRGVRWVAEGGALAGIVALRALALGGLQGATDAYFLDNPAAAAGAWPRVATALWVQVRYAWLQVWPAQLSSDYSYDAVPVVRSPADPRFLAGVALAAVLVWVAFRAYRARSALPGVAVAVWFLFLLPSSNLLFPAGTLMAERLTYLPSLAACLLAGHGLAAWAARSEGASDRKRRLVPVLAVAVGMVALLAVRTVQRNPDWKDNRTLAAADVRVQPRSAKLHAGLAIAAHRDGDLGVAERHYREALGIWAGYAQVHHNLGVLLERTGRDPEALASYREAARLAPGNPRPWKALAPLLWSRGARDEALAAYASGSRADPADAAFRYRYGRALLLAGRAGEGKDVLRELAADRPDGWPGLLASAVVRRLEGDPAGSDAILERLRGRADLPEDVRKLVERNTTGGDR